MLTSANAAPRLVSDLDVSSEGYFVLSWDNDRSDPERVLQQSTSTSFSSELEQWSVSGANQFTLSGLTDGIYYYRLVDSTGSSNTVSVRVAHHSLGRAGLFFTLGALLFGVLVSVLLVGRRLVQESDS